jgi:hypothetical protein
MATKRRAHLLCWALLWFSALIVLIEIAASVARELRSVQLGMMAAGLTLLLVVALRSSLPSRRR